MKSLSEFITENIVSEAKNKYSLFPKTKPELYSMIKREIEKNGAKCSLNHIDITPITDLSRLFEYDQYDNKVVGSFNGDISKWNVSKVTNMKEMFKNSYFNGDISKWNVSNVEDMSGMFSYCDFNGDISKWDVSNVEDMSSMFSNGCFNGDISKWDVSNVEDMEWMFGGSRTKFDGSKGDISKWDVSNVRNVREMFYDNEKFDLDLSKWDIKISERLWMNGMFKYSKLENKKEKWPIAVKNIIG